MNFISKYIFKFLLFLFLLSSSAWAYDGIVIVLEAPLLSGPGLNFTVVQTLRKGSRVYIPNEVVKNGKVPDFIPTFDRAGGRAYIQGNYVKVILGTTAENEMPITLAGHDPTDYRLQEPIPSTYPFEDRAYVRASVALTLANSLKSPYDYNSSYNKQEYPSEIGTRVVLSKKVNHDVYDRFYFGILGSITTAKNTVEFKNDYLAKENRSIVRVGPLLSYDTFRDEKYRITLGTGFTFNYHRTTLFVDSGASSEERIFSGFSLAPVISSNFQVSDVLPYTDLVAGMDLSLFLPFTQKDAEEIQVPDLWNASNQIKSGLKPQASLFLGVQVKY